MSDMAPPSLKPLCTQPPADPLLAECLATHAAAIYPRALKTTPDPLQLVAGLATVLQASVPPNAKASGLAAVPLLARALAPGSDGLSKLWALLKTLGRRDTSGDVRAAAMHAVPELVPMLPLQELVDVLIHGMQV